MKYYYRIIKRFFELRATNKKLLAHLFFSAFLRTVSFFATPFAASLVIDAATDQNYVLAAAYAFLFFASAALYVTCHHYNYWSYAQNANYIHNNLQQQVLEKVATLDQDFSENLPKSEIINTAFEDIDMNKQIPDLFFDFATHVVGIFADAIILVFVDPLIGVITLSLTIISMVIFTYHMKRRDYYADIQRTRQDEISGLYSQVIDGHKEVHSFNMETNLRDLLEKYKNTWKYSYGKKRIHQDLAETTVPIILGLGRIAIYLIAGALILKGEYGISMLVLVIGYFEDIQDSYDKAVDTVYNLTKCSVAVNRMHRLLNFKNKHLQKFGSNNTDEIKGRVEFNEVSFTYGRQPLMKDVSFIIEPSSLTGIVGKSGSGKSTIFRLLLRLYKPTKGQITIDGENIYNYTKKVYASNVSIVTQKPFVFDMTIRENLGLVDNNVEHQIAACKTAGIHDDIMRLEKGYDTPLIGDAANLSTGQKQLLALARTLLSKSEVLLFDEVTSALDADTSKQIVDVLKKLKKDHTILVITHKPEIMRKMDELLVIDHGKLVGRGTHKNLSKANNYYKTLQK